MRLQDLAKPFPESDIEWRVGQSGEKRNNGGVWAMVLAYVQARAVMTRLDEVCGPENWNVKYHFISSTESAVPGVIASIGIKIGDEWVYKEDGAEQTHIESFKGGISSALKRAAVVWGIGRYLYGLESEFAEISDTQKEGFKWAQTKEKKTFYWKPPRLPTWALPSDEKKAAVETKPKEPEPKKEVNKSRPELVADVLKVSEELGLSHKALSEWGEEIFKKPMNKLSNEELFSFCERLQGELGRKGDLA